MVIMAGQAALQVEYVKDRSSAVLLQQPGVLAVFEFGKSPLESTDPRHVTIALPQLDGGTTIEVWRCNGEIETGTWQTVRFARNGAMTMAHIALDINDAGDMRAASHRAYQEFQRFLRQSPHHCPMKIWNYIPGINEGEGDSESYRQFCIGRAEALASDPAERPPMPAATAIGSPREEAALQVYFLATALPGVNVENPRQLNAWHYPRRYGPRSPLFSRGTIMQVGAARQFLISGTASVVGHETHHDNVRDQITESVSNLNSLLQEGQRLLGGQRPRLGDTGVLRVYLRNPSDLADIKQALGRIVPDDMPRVYLNGDICRIDLLTEVDGIIACE